MGRRCPARQTGARKAFTLIEVLITLVVLSTGIVLVLRAIQTSLVALGSSRDVVWASLLTDRKIVELETGEASATSGQGRFSRPYEDFRWARRVTRDSGDGSNVLYNVSISIWRDGVDRKYTATTKLYLGGGK